MYLSSVLILEYFRGQEGEEGWIGGFPLRSSTTGAALLGPEESLVKLSPLSITCLPTAQSSTNSLKRNQTRRQPQCKVGKVLHKPKKKKKIDFTKLLALRLNQVEQLDLCPYLIPSWNPVVQTTRHMGTTSGCQSDPALPHKKLTTLQGRRGFS